MNRDFRENLVAATATILETLKIIDTHGVPIGLVHDNGRLLGTVTDGDIRRSLLAGVSLSAPVSEVMNTSPITVSAAAADALVLQVMKQRAILYVPMVDDSGRVVGLKALKDLQATGTAANPVMLMAGGLGTRLKPLTDEAPKPMLEVGGKPILETIIENFVEQGFTEIFVSVNYKKEMIENHFLDGAKWGAKISYVYETEPMGTAGALSLLPEPPSRPLIVMNGDLLTKVNFNHLAKFHEEHGAPATICVREYKFTVPYGVVEADDHYLSSIEEKPVQKFFVNAGIYVLGPEAVSEVSAGKPFDMPDLLTNLTKTGRRPTVFPLREYWVDIGRVDDLNQARREFNGIFPSP